MNPVDMKMPWDVRVCFLNKPRKAPRGKIFVTAKAPTRYEAFWDAIHMLEDEHAIDTTSLHQKAPEAPEGILSIELRPEDLTYTGQVFICQIELRVTSHKLFLIKVDNREYGIKLSSEPTICRYTLLDPSGRVLVGEAFSKAISASDEALLQEIISRLPTELKDQEIQIMSVKTHRPSGAQFNTPFQHDKELYEVHRDLFKRNSFASWEKHIEFYIDRGSLRERALNWTLTEGPQKEQYNDDGNGDYKGTFPSYQCDMTPEDKVRAKEFSQERMENHEKTSPARSERGTLKLSATYM